MAKKKVAAHPLIGTVLKGEKKVTPYTFADGSTYDSVMIKLDESAVEMLTQYFGKKPCIRMTGYMYPANIDMGRTNVRVNDDLTITEVYNG